MMREEWVEVELGEVCNINMGQSPPSSTYNIEKNGLPFFQGKAEFTDLFPVVRKWCSEPKKIAETDDVLLSVRAPVGATNIANQKCAIGRGLAAISYSACHKYIFYYLRSIERKLDEQGTGSTFKAISGGVLKAQIIPLAPLPEQRAIVAKIEKLFSDLDNGIANLKAAKAKLDIYRQAVLKKAFEGELTKEWRGGQAGLPNSWKWVKLGEVCEKVQDGSHFSPKEKYTGKKANLYPYITSKNIRNNHMDLSDLEYVGHDFHESIYNRCDPKFGDVLLTKDGVNTGNVTLNIFEEPISLLSSVCMIRPNKEILSSSYIKYYIQSPTGFKEMTGQMTGTAIKRIILKKVKNTEIPIPPTVEEQTAIVAAFESRLSVCDKLAESIDQSLEKSEALRQSILKKAFAGNLLSAAELAVCRQEPDWEPADKLLKWIREAKA